VIRFELSSVAINDWASQRLGRPFDDNDGVLGWFPLSEGVRVHPDDPRNGAGGRGATHS